MDGLANIIGLSMLVSIVAAGAAAVCGLPAGAVLALYRFPGRDAAVLAVHALLGLPPVVVGLALYLLLSRAGPLGGLGLLFTPGAMMLAQFLLALPIVTALSHRATLRLWSDYGDELVMAGASRLWAMPVLLAIGRADAVLAVLAGFGRALSEVGAILIVGGNIAGHTRTMTTAITLLTGQGQFTPALALGAVLITLSLLTSTLAFVLQRRRWFVLAGALLFVPVPGQAAETIVLASTTSVQDSGLLEHVLPLFTAETGIVVRVVAVGTGQALAIAARGDADLALVHDPAAEDEFLAAGFGHDRVRIAWNDFIVVGPAQDPAGVRGERDISAAFRHIAAAHAPFLSRGDQSGTHAMERRLWQRAGIKPSGDWYRDVGAGMGVTLNLAASMDAYTLTDRGTWLSHGAHDALPALVEGDPALLNRYSTIELTRAPQPVPAHRLAQWLQGPAGQAAIAAYRRNGQVLFHPAADPEPS